MSRLDLSLESVVVKFDEKEIRFYPLNFKALRTVNKELEALRSTDGDQDNRLFAICRILEASANRKGEQTTAEELAELLDPVSSKLIMDEINRVSGFRKIAIEGEAEDVARPTKALNGAASTQGSSQQLDGLSIESTN